MGVSKQATMLKQAQIRALQAYLSSGRNADRNLLIFLLSTKAGLRAKEIAALTWDMVLDASGSVGSVLNLTNKASKGRSGRVIPLNKALREQFIRCYEQEGARKAFTTGNRVIRTERSPSTSAQAIVNMFRDWYRRLEFVGCSSHSGRRTFITNAARKITTVGGSLRDVQMLAGHSNLQTTQRYIEYDTDSQRRVVDLV